MMTLTQPLSSLILILLVTSHLHTITSLTTAIPKVQILKSLASNSVAHHSRHSNARGNPRRSTKSEPEKPLSDSPWFQNPLQNSGYGSQPGNAISSFGYGPFPVLRELVNLGPLILPGNSPCASILTTSNCLLQVPDDATHIDIQDRQFIFATGLIKDKCSLTIQDCTGSFSTFINHFFPYGGTFSTAASVCCECNGCNRLNLPIHQNGKSCAVLFEHEKCSFCHGFRLEVSQGDSTATMNVVVDDKVSSIYVAPGCELKVFEDSYFQGSAALAFGSLDYLPTEWNDRISSFECDCSNTKNPPTSSTTTTPTSFTIPVSTTTTTPIRSSTTDSATTTTQFVSLTSSTEMPQTVRSTTNFIETTTSTTSMPVKSTTVIAEETTTTVQSYPSTAPTTEKSTEFTTETEPPTTTKLIVELTTTAETAEPTTEFDDSNLIY